MTLSPYNKNICFDLLKKHSLPHRLFSIVVSSPDFNKTKLKNLKHFSFFVLDYFLEFINVYLLQFKFTIKLKTREESTVYAWQKMEKYLWNFPWKMCALLSKPITQSDRRRLERCFSIWKSVKRDWKNFQLRRCERVFFSSQLIHSTT